MYPPTVPRSLTLQKPCLRDHVVPDSSFFYKVLRSRVAGCEMASQWTEQRSRRYPDRVYYYNTVTKKSTWERPPEMDAEVQVSFPSAGATVGRLFCRLSRLAYCWHVVGYDVTPLLLPGFVLRGRLQDAAATARVVPSCNSDGRSTGNNSCSPLFVHSVVSVVVARPLRSQTMADHVGRASFKLAPSSPLDTCCVLSHGLHFAPKAVYGLTLLVLVIEVKVRAGWLQLSGGGGQVPLGEANSLFT